MKLRYLFATLVAALTIFAGCEPEADHFLEEVQVSSSYLAFPAGGGSVPVTVTAIADWTVKDLPEWISASAKAGAAGESTVNFTATAATETREASFSIECAGKSQTINAIQVTEKVEPKLTSMKDVIEAGAGNFRICGTVTKIANTSYGNWYLNDGTTDANDGLGIYVYGTLDKKGNTWSKDPAKENINCPGNPDAWEFAVGDKLTVEGPYSFYNGTTPEMVDVTVISIERSLISVDSIELLGVAEGAGVTEFPKEGGSIKVTLKNKGEGFHVVIPEEAKSWLHIEDFGSDYVTLTADANEGGDRKVSVSFTTTADGVAYSCEQEFTQPGAILEVPIADFLAAAVGDTQYRLTGVVTKGYDSDSQGQSFYMKDWSGETLVYRLNDFVASGAKIGDIITIVGKRSAFKDNPQVGSGVYESHIPVTPVSIAEFLAKPDDKTTYYMVTGNISSLLDNKGNENDYGNLYITDGTNEVYLYGLYPGWGATGDNRKGFVKAAGIEVGDKLTSIGYKDTYNGLVELCGGIYFSHEKGSGPQPGGEFDYTPSAEYSASSNLWKPVDDSKGQRYFYSVNPDWAGQIYAGSGSDLPPYGEFQQSTYKLTFDTATTGRWQNQFFVHPDEGHFIPLDPAKTYKFSVTAQSTAAFNAFFKLVAYNPANDNREGATIWEPAGDSDPSNIFFEANKPVVLENEITGVSAENINVFFDLGGNPAGAIVYIKDITISEVGGGSGDAPALFLNEFDTQNKKLEIYNSTDAEVDIAGWQFVKDDGLEDKDIYTIPASLEASKVPAKGYAVFTCKQTDAANGPLFGLSGTKGFKIELKKGDTVVDVADNLTSITQIPDGSSWGRETDGAPNFVLFDTPTIGASNGAAAPQGQSITEILALEKGAEVTSAESLVSAVTSRGFIATDGSKAVYVYTSGSDFNGVAKVGDKVKFAGSKTVYNGVHEIEKVSALEVASSGNSVSYPEPKDITASIASYDASEAEFITYVGTLKVSGNYFNIEVDGADASAKMGSLVYPVDTDAAKALDGKHLRFTGYFNGLSGSGKYVNIISTSIEEVADEGPVNITIDGNFDDWAGVPGAEPSGLFNAFKVTNDADNFYFYIETDPGSRLWTGGGYLYLYFNFKNDLTQGAYGGATGMGDNKYDAYIFMYLFGGSADAPKIEDNPNGGEAKGMTMDNIVIAGNKPATSSDIVKMEIVIPRANFETKVNAGDVIAVDSYRSKDGGNVYFPGYVVK